jgi:hypothetical protein
VQSVYGKATMDTIDWQKVCPHEVSLARDKLKEIHIVKQAKELMP